MSSTSSTGPFRIGYIDYQLENYHANVYLKAYRDELKDQNAVIAGCWGMDENIGKAWATKNEVTWYSKPANLVANVDAIMILAPSNPELHLPLLRKVAGAGKPVYMDKPSAQDTRTLKKIFELADQHGVALQTTSALRYTSVQTAAAQLQPGELKHITAWGGGSSFEEYGIHPTEMAVSCMGSKVETLMVRQNGNVWQLLVNFDGGRTATIQTCVNASSPFCGTLVTDTQVLHIQPETNRLFLDTAAAVLSFLKSGVPNIPREESLAVRRILDAAAKPAALKRFIDV